MAKRPRRAATPRALAPQQQRFCEEYLVDLNGTQAAIRAGYSVRTAQEQASRLLSNVMVQAEVERLAAARSQRTQITADRVLQEIARLAFVDVRKLFDGNRLKDLSALDDDTAAALASVEIDELYEYVDGHRHSIGQTKKVKVWNKTENLKLLAQHLRLLVERHEHSGALNIYEVSLGDDPGDDSP